MKEGILQFTRYNPKTKYRTKNWRWNFQTLDGDILVCCCRPRGFLNIDLATEEAHRLLAKKWKWMRRRARISQDKEGKWQCHFKFWAISAITTNEYETAEEGEAIARETLCERWHFVEENVDPRSSKPGDKRCNNVAPVASQFKAGGRVPLDYVIKGIEEGL
jgi:hypothetical protein